MSLSLFFKHMHGSPKIYLSGNTTSKSNDQSAVHTSILIFCSSLQLPTTKVCVAISWYFVNLNRLLDLILNSKRCTLEFQGNKTSCL